MTFKKALLFPGQGAHHPGMLEGVKRFSHFKSRYPMLCDHLASDPLLELKKNGPAYLNSNLVSSLLTAFVSTLSYDVYRERGGAGPDYLSGYSVGQWTALWAAEVVDFEKLIEIISVRSRMMDACVHGDGGGMIAVIGLSETVLSELCSSVGEEGEYLTISNYNCAGQYSIAGTAKALEKATDRLENFELKKFIKLPVRGAWHTRVLDGATDRFLGYLKDIPLSEPKVPVVNNVTGTFFEADMEKNKKSLAEHLNHPVRWEEGIRTILESGCDEFIEIGYGNTLTKFGYFISRKVRHSFFYN